MGGGDLNLQDWDQTTTSGDVAIVAVALSVCSALRLVRFDARFM